MKMKTPEIAKLFNVSGERLRQLAHEGYFSKPIRGEWDLKNVAAGLVAYLQNRLKARRDSPEFIEAKQDKMRADAQLSSITLGEKQNSLISREAVETVWAARKAGIRDVVQNSLLPKPAKDEICQRLCDIPLDDYLNVKSGTK
jgi:hypothetical protein